MTERKRYEMTDADLAALLEASKPTPGMFLSDGHPTLARHLAWADLGNRLGFDYMTVEPTSEGQRVFTAEER